MNEYNLTVHLCFATALLTLAPIGSTTGDKHTREEFDRRSLHAKLQRHAEYNGQLYPLQVE